MNNINIFDTVEDSFVCPITAVIGAYDQPNENDNLVVIDETEVICDDVLYQMTLDTIEVARFTAKNTRKSPEDIQEASVIIYDRLFADIGGKDYIEAYSILFPKVLINHHLLGNQLKKICVIFDNIGKLNGPKIKKDVFDGLPQDKHCQIIEKIDYITVRRPDVLIYQLNEFTNYVNTFLSDKIKIPDFEIPIFPENKVIPSDHKTIEDINEILKHKLILLEYMNKLQILHCKAIEYINKLIKTLIS